VKLVFCGTSITLRYPVSAGTEEEAMEGIQTNIRQMIYIIGNLCYIGAFTLI
jgi:hypothetical protein